MQLSSRYRARGDSTLILSSSSSCRSGHKNQDRWISTRLREQLNLLCAMTLLTVALLIGQTTVTTAASIPLISDSTQLLFVDGLNGSNTNNGSVSAPYQTLNHTVEVVCSKLTNASASDTVTVIIAPVSPEFVYTEEIVFPWTCVKLNLIITSIAPVAGGTAAEDETGSEEAATTMSDSMSLLDIPMAQLNWTTFNGSAIMNLLFDHVTFVDQTVLYFFPNIDFGAKEMYTLSLQNCVVQNVSTDMILLGSEDQEEQPQLLSGTQLLLNNSLVINSAFPDGFVFVWAGNPTYAYITSTTFVDNNGPLWTSSYVTILVFDHCEIRNNTADDVYGWLISPRLIYQESVAPDAIPPVFNFTDNIVNGNSFQQLLRVVVDSGPSFIEHNKVTNNVVAIDVYGFYDNATCQVVNNNQTFPIVVSNNLFACNGATDGTFYAFLNRDLSDPQPTTWILANNVNGDPVNCPIRPRAGNEMADSVNTQTCTPGYYNNCNPGSTHCIPCGPGSFSNQFASSSCSLCDAGSYANNEAATFCMPCNSGNFSSQAGATSCDKCPIGTCTSSYGYQTKCQPDPCPSTGIDRD